MKHDGASIFGPHEVRALDTATLRILARHFDRQARHAESVGDYAEMECYRATADTVRFEMHDRTRRALTRQRMRHESTARRFLFAAGKLTGRG